MPSDLLADLKEDHHEELIRSGNLIRNPKPREVWTGGKYLAEISHRVCQCGVSQDILDRISHVETSSLGASRKQTLDVTTFLQFPTTEDFPIQRTTLHVKFCPSCLPLNFKG